jgi:hypothetical protein
VRRSCDEEKIEIKFRGGNSDSKKRKRGYGGANGGVWWSLRLAGNRNLESGSRFCVCAFGRNLASAAVKMFSRLIYFIKTFYKFFLLSVRFAKIMLQ